MREGLLIAAHGSRDASGVDELWALADAWRTERPDRLQEAGFLEFAEPTIGEAIDRLVAAGADRVVVVPAMLMAAGHVKNDVPCEVHEARARYPKVVFQMARALDIHPRLLELCEVRYHEAVAGREPIAASETMLVVVGRGTSDPDANANIARVCRFLWESLGLGWGSIAFSGLATPSVDHALSVCRRMGFRRLVVLPYFLFDGILLKRIRETAARHASEDENIEIITTEHMKLHPLLVRAFEDRAFEAGHGTALMNCDLCKYRVHINGYEDALGEPQAGHHYQVRARRADEDRGHGHGARRRRRVEPSVGVHLDESVHTWDSRLLERLLEVT